MDRITLYEEFRLIERNENEVNVAWKGAHLLLFFLAFVFGSFCTFCFHVLMYMFDQKCVLFPKIVSHASLRQIVYEFFSINADTNEAPELPVDFLSTQWVEKSVCYLPTYVPLVSGLFGLVWTTMYLMCSSGASNLTGLQKQWRAQPPMFVFSVAMSGLCIYSSVITHNGLQDLCTKLAEVTGSSSCTHTVNVATLAYERRIKGVYQATQLTIATAWLHTACWLLSALLTLVRVVLAVDFQLVRVKADLIGDIDRMLEKYERHIHSVSPEPLTGDESSASSEDDEAIFILPTRETGGTVTIDMQNNQKTFIYKKQFHLAQTDAVYVSDKTPENSEPCLVPEEHYKLAKISAIQAVPRKHQFIVKLLYRLLESLDFPKSELYPEPVLRNLSEVTTASSTVFRQIGHENIISPRRSPEEILSPEQANKLAIEIRRSIRDHDPLTEELDSLNNEPTENPNQLEVPEVQSKFNLTPELRKVLKIQERPDEAPAVISEPTTSKAPLKSSFKTKAVQTEGKNLLEKIVDSVHSFKFEPHEETSEDDKREEDKKNDDTEGQNKENKKNKNTQTPKEKQD